MSELLTTVLMQRAKLKSSAKDIRENVDFVLGELPQLDAAKDDKLRTEKTFARLKSFLDELVPILNRIDGALGKFLDAPHSISAQIIKESLASIEFREQLFEMHELVQSLKNEAGMLFILVAESAANILNAEGKLKEAASEMVSVVDQALLELGTSSPSLDSFSLPCNLCENDDCVSFCVVDSDNNHPFYAISQEPGTGSLVVNHGKTILKLGAERLQSTRTAIVNRDMKTLLELLESGYPFCSKCSLAFCAKHWTDIHPVFDDGFYDCTYATCPKGHRIMIDD